MQGIIHDSRTFPEMIGQMPEDALIIFVRDYNSKSNIDLLGEREYIGALKPSDHHVIMKLEIEHDSDNEIRKNEDFQKPPP